MIKYENGRPEVPVSKSAMKAELTCIIESLYEAGDLNKEDINLIVKLATEPEELLKENLSDPEKLLIMMLGTVKRMKRDKRGRRVMIKKICYGDRCNAVTNEPVELALGSLDIETGDISSWPGRPDSNLQLCNTCARLVLRFATTAPDEERPTPEEVSPPSETEDRQGQDRSPADSRLEDRRYRRRNEAEEQPGIEHFMAGAEAPGKGGN